MVVNSSKVFNLSQNARRSTRLASRTAWQYFGPRFLHPTAIAKEQPRNKSAEVKCVARINSCRSRRIVTISFSPKNGVWHKLSLTWSREVQQKWSMYSVLSHRVLEFSASVDNMNRVVVVSAFYETKRTADEQCKYLSPRMINKSTNNSVNLSLSVNWCLARAAIKSQCIHSVFNTYVVLLISDIDIKGSD